MTNWNVVKRLANQNHVNCLFDVISQSDMSSFSQSREKDMLRVQRTVRNGEARCYFSLGCSAKVFAVSLLSDQLAQSEGTVDIS